MLLGSQQTVWATQGAVFHVRITVCSLHQISLLKQEAQNNQSGVVLPLSSSGFFFCLFIHSLMYSFIQQILINCLPFYILCLFPKRIWGCLWNQIWCKNRVPRDTNRKKEEALSSAPKVVRIWPCLSQKKNCGVPGFYSLPNQNIQIMWRI